MWMLMDFLIKLNDILKGEIRVNNVIRNQEDFEIPEVNVGRLPVVPKELEKKEFVDRMKALSEEELGWLMEVIPLELCLKKIEREVARVEEYKRVVKDISKAFE